MNFNSVSMRDITMDFLQLNIDLSIEVRDDYWFISCMNEKQSRLFNQNNEIID